jgi:MFS transporter, DHA3 family, tetracycline resistance protein
MLTTRPDFRRAYLANAVSQLGDSFQFVAVVWLAVITGGTFGVIAVRLADGLPGLFLALHGGSSADRRDRRRTMVTADLVRGVVLAPVAVAGLTGHLSIWAVAPAGFVVASATSYFQPAFGASLPGLAGRENVQRANGLVSATNSALMVTGRALAAALLALISIGSFFAVNAASFFVSAALLARVRIPRELPADGKMQHVAVREGFAALRVRPGLRVAIAMLAVGTAVMTGVWTVGVAELARDRFGHGAASLSLLLTATAIGSVSVGTLLVRRPMRMPVRLSCAAWVLLLPGYVLLGTAGSLPLALAGSFVIGVANGAALVLVTTAAQQSVPDELLGRVMGIVFLANVGAKPVGLLLVAPLYTLVGVRTMFVAGGIVAALAGTAAMSAVVAATRTARAARAARAARSTI